MLANHWKYLINMSPKALESEFGVLQRAMPNPKEHVSKGDRSKPQGEKSFRSGFERPVFPKASPRLTGSSAPSNRNKM